MVVTGGWDLNGDLASGTLLNMIAFIVVLIVLIFKSFQKSLGNVGSKERSN